MLKIFIAFFIFCIVLFIYLHVQFHLKTSNDLEVYELDQASKDKLDEICDLRQPVIFDFDNDKILQTINKTKGIFIEYSFRHGNTMPKYFYQIFNLFDTYILYGILIA
jgi:hypothetical protein